ncbi:MAG: APA family basic amino acid/polyamine antiporter [Cocleimonas sp.]|jgi:APA family basic amino acid/polyamine antiporter
MATQLKRCLSLPELVIYGVGLILGAGIYVLIGSAAGIAGNMLWLSFVLAAIVASFTAMSYAELSALFPEAGAEYIYVKKAFGWEKIAWFFGFIAIVIGFSTASAVALGFARYLSYFLPMNQIFLAIGLLVAMTGINLWGIKESARFNVLAATIEVGGLMFIIIVGAYFILKGDFPLANLTEFPPMAKDSSLPWLPIVSASALIFFAYMGFEDIANIAEEAENPVEILPKAFIYTLFISTVIYILIAIVVVSIVPFQELAAAEQPLSLVMTKLIGGKSSQLIAIIALFATANTVLITLIVCARMIYGMAKSNTLPSSLAKVHPKHQTPYVAITIVGLITIIFLFFKEVEVLAAISDVGIFTLFFMVNLSNIVLRYRSPELPRSWRTPLNIGRLPVISLLGVISCTLMLITIDHPVHLGEYQFPAQVVGLFIFIMAIPLYYIFNRK